MLDIQLRPEKYLTAEDVGYLVGRDECLVQQMYPLRRLHALDNARYNQINPRCKPGS